MTKLVADFKYGTLSAGIGSTDTTITSAEFADLPVVSSPDTMDLVLNPGEVGGDAEIVTVTAHTSASTSVTVAARTGSAHGSGTQWVHAVTAADFNRMGFDGTLEGNADTATALETARNIGGVSFDGTANINLPGVNTAGNQDTSGNAATATSLATARTINGTSFDGTANITVTAAAGTLTGSTLASGVTASSLTSVGTLTSLTVSGSATSDSYRWGGTSYLTSTTTSALESELLARDVFDSSFSAFKTGWSYAGNGNLTDAGRLTELAGTSWLTWTDNSADNTLGNYTALVIAPNTGGSGGGVFVYNDQGSGYSPGWRELWNSSRTIVGPDGSAGAPAYSFADDTDTGMYSDGSNSISFATAGTQRLDVDGGGIKGKVPFMAKLGSAAAPGYGFDGDTDTGFYRYGSGTIGWSGNNNTGGYLFNNGIRTDNGTAGVPSHSFSSDTNTGVYRVASDQIGFTTGGSLRGRFYSGGLLMGGASTGAAQIGTGTGSAGAPVYHFYGDTNTGMYRSAADQIAFAAGGVLNFQVLTNGVYVPSGSNYFGVPSTGTGNDAEWASTGFGTYLLRRNNSLAAEKENITDDLGTHLTADMIDSVVPKLWNRLNSPGYPEIGPLAEDMDAISPFLAAHGADITDGTYQEFLTGINKTAYLSLLVLAVKDLRTRVAELEAG